MELTVDWRNNYIDKFEKLTPFSNPPRGQKSKYVFMSNPARCRRWTHGPVRRHSIFSGLALKSQKHPQWDTSMGEGDAMERGVEGEIFRGGGGQCKRGRSSSPLMSSVTLGCDCWNSGGMFVIVGHSFFAFWIPSLRHHQCFWPNQSLKRSELCNMHTRKDFSLKFRTRYSSS